MGADSLFNIWLADSYIFHLALIGRDGGLIYDVGPSALAVQWQGTVGLVPRSLVLRIL